MSWGHKPADLEGKLNILAIRDWWNKRQQKKRDEFEWVYECG